ncbi:hypothetical protein AZE42_03781 [Rhizopogon vesiculosus]|uniref:SAM domain-containing protein n=1 Tax=Rhizopogon vesiculosus TaxID=180088 RepID=A0A1J8PKC7_9AGAM|nr:hypothetical protein AZE42_03781 [Rhizopogon vesiculosus]
MTSTTVSPSPSPTLFPSKKHPTILPNAHPYAIKTTSSAVLSRSNSSPHSASSVKHHYVPPSPTRPRHRHTSSASSVEGAEIAQPPPLPVPPSISPTRASFTLDEGKSRRLRRAETLPPTSAVPILNDNAVVVDNKLPRNPKQWSADDLASYITTSLQTGGELDTEDKGLVLHAIKEKTITGRDFLRLTDANLASLSLTAAQQLYLLKASRALRADILRSRIWVDSYHSKDISARSKDVYTRSIRGSNSGFNGSLYRSSASSVDLVLQPSASIGADEELPPSPAMTLNRSNSVSDSSAQRYRDLAHMRIRRRGKVKGLVETWERERGTVSGSEGSMSGSDAESDSDIPSVGSPPPPALSNSTSSLSIPPPPYTSLRDNEDEPTIEELLTSSGPIEGARAWEEDCGLGETVKWIPTGTPTPLPFAPLPPKEATSFEINAESTECSVDCNLSKLSVSRSGRANKQKRVVTAIFTGGSGGTIDNSSESGAVDEVPQANTTPGVINIRDDAEIEVAAVESAAQPDDVFLAPEQVARQPSDDDAVITALEVSIANTRAQLETFRVRLEAVEAQIVTQEAAHQAQFHPEDARLPPNEHQPCIRLPDEVDFVFSDYNLGLRNFARSILARTMGWIYPPVVRHRPVGKAPRSREASRSPVRPPVLAALRLPYMIIFSFVLCAAVLRRLAFGRGVQAH